MASAAAAVAACSRCCRAPGLDRYYTLRGERTLSPVNSERAAHEQPWLDAVVASLAAQPGVHRIALDVQGIQCGACVWLMEALFNRQVDGYQIAVNPALGGMSLSVGASFGLADFVSAVESFGYRLGTAKKVASSENHSLLLRTGICLALAINTMLLSTSTYFGLERAPVAIFRTIRDGVPAKGMPAWGASLGRTGVAQVAAFVLSLRDTNVPGKASEGEPYDPTVSAASADAPGVVGLSVEGEPGSLPGK